MKKTAKNETTQQEFCRRVQLVINNPQEQYPHDTIKQILSTLKSIVYWCMCDEIGIENQTYHTHLYIKFKNTIRFSTIKKKFPTAHIESCYGTSSQNRAYIRKEGKKFETKKETNLSDTFEESGELEEEHPGKRTDYEVILKEIQENKSTADILLSHPDTLHLLSNIDKARTTLLEQQYRDLRRLDLSVVYVQGETGFHKTRTIMDEHGDGNVYRVTDYKRDPFGGYNAQPVLCFEEFRNSFPIEDMLNYLDVYPVFLPARYNNRVACYLTVYIVTNWKFEEQYQGIMESHPETYRAWVRRIHTIRVYSAKGIFEDFTTGQYLLTQNFEDADPDFLPFDTLSFSRDLGGL